MKEGFNVLAESVDAFKGLLNSAFINVQIYAERIEI